jgi:hypothetical protein
MRFPPRPRRVLRSLRVAPMGAESMGRLVEVVDGFFAGFGDVRADSELPASVRDPPKSRVSRL